MIDLIDHTITPGGIKLGGLFKRCVQYNTPGGFTLTPSVPCHQAQTASYVRIGIFHLHMVDLIDPISP